LTFFLPISILFTLTNIIDDGIIIEYVYYYKFYNPRIKKMFNLILFFIIIGITLTQIEALILSDSVNNDRQFVSSLATN
jgi:hypothetical protein